jgi:hypothetical protein
MKRIRQPRRARRVLQRTARVFGHGNALARVDGRVTLAVLWAVSRLALKLGPA